ncbi:molybdopterin oxidoreductase family protein [Halodesulfurarchaeum sp.]|uniref:molybdopterin oxidoreductase family protein n=1 Tax=Halodesulfurarchaeum sp. TaxID=1980530 RepID=UPI002FC3A4A3
MSSISFERRDFLKAAGGTAIVTAAGSSRVLAQSTEEETESGENESPETVKTICTHCAVGCGLKLEVENDAVVGLQRWEDNPVNQGGLCSKGASLTDTVNSETRLKEPMKKVDGDWQAISWDEALSEIAEELDRIREEYTPDSVMWMGSAKVNNEEAYLQRKFAAFYGTNNVDHQARICHSTTVSGLANTWGFGAQTNPINDYRNQDANLIIGHNPTESHPVMMQYPQKMQDNGGTIIVAEPRFTKTSAQADKVVRFRPGTDTAFINGLLYHIVFNLEAHDEQFIQDRVYGWADVKENLQDYDLETVSDITWVDVEELKEVAEILAKAEVSTVDWAMGATQHNNGTQNIRSFATLNLALGHSAQPGGGLNVVRGHDNVQGATDLGVLSNTLPGYYGLGEGAWRHWASVWDQTPSTSGSTSYDDMFDRFHSKDIMEKNGFTVSRWYEGAHPDTTAGEDFYQPEPIKAVMIWGHSLNSVSEMNRMKEAMEELELIVGIDPYPALTSSLPDRDDGIILLPAATQLETRGSVTNTHRSIQWRNKVVDPRHNSKSDFEIAQDLAERLGFGEHFDYDEIEDVTREWNLGMRTIGMIGQTPERMKAHQENAGVFSPKDLKAEVTDDHDLAGDYYGMPWPSWHKDHPGTPILYDAGKHPAAGGADFRTRWGTEGPDGETLIRNSYEPDWWDGTLEGVPQYPMWHTALPDPDDPAAMTIPIEYAEREDMSVYDAARALADEGYDVDPAEYTDFDHAQPDPPTGRGRARGSAWNQYDAVPVHREPIETPRPDLAEEFPTYEDMEDVFRVNLNNQSKQLDRSDLSDSHPMIMTTGRQVEHTGGGAETRNNPYTAERAPFMYAEINPKVANELGVDTGGWITVGTKRGTLVVQARVTERVNQEEIFLPFHWGGIFEGESLLDRYPDGFEPVTIGDSANIGTSDGYDPHTMMQETKANLAVLDKADPEEIPELPEKQLAYQEEKGLIRRPLGGDD